MQSPAHSDMDFSETQHSSLLGVGDAHSQNAAHSPLDASTDGFSTMDAAAKQQYQSRRGSLPTDLITENASRASTADAGNDPTDASRASTSLISLVNRSGMNARRRGSGDSGTNNHRTVNISSQLRFPRSIMITRVDDKIFDCADEKARFAQIFKNIDPECTVLFFKTFNRVRVDFTHHQAAVSARKMVTSSTENNLPLAGLPNGHQQHAPPLTDHGQRSQSSDTLLNGHADNTSRPLASHNMKCIWFFNILQEMKLDSTLKPPKLEKQFLISPPASPPVGWEPAPEHEPIIDYDVLTAIAELDPGHSHELHPSGGDEHPAIVFHPCPDDESDAGAAIDDNTSDDLTEDDSQADQQGTLRRASSKASPGNNSDKSYETAGKSDEEAPHLVTSGKRTRRRVQIKMVSANSVERADSFSDDQDTTSNASSASSSPSRRRNVAMRIGNHRVVIPHTRRPPPLSPSSENGDAHASLPQ